MSTLKVTHLQNESNSAPSISISNAVGGGVTFAGISTFHGATHVFSSAYPTATIQRDHAINYPRLRIINTANDGADLDGLGDGTGGFRIACVAAGVSTERLRVTSSGNVNIGPSANANDYGLLTLSQSASAAFNALVIQQGNTAFTATDGLHIGIDAGVHAYFKLYENRDIYFTSGTSNTEKLRITSSGKMGLGYNSPDTMGTGRLVIGNGSGSETLTIFSSSTTNGNIHFADGTNSQDRYRGYITYQHSDGVNDNYMAFGTDDVERLRITSAGKLLLPSNSPGIQFGSPDDPAASGGIDISSQTLDDYEEGTWTPDIVLGTVSGHKGHYTKVGRLVTVSGYVNNFSDRSSSSPVRVSGLPFADGDSNDSCCGSFFGRYISKPYYGVYMSGDTLYFYGTVNTDYNYVEHDNLSANAGATIYFTATYQTNE